tara:strand:+ start:2498 stop:3037 length:540 start_codon:yes stop_codon:yes gene_type:complete
MGGNLRIALTGTPGTGKSSLARIISENGIIVESLEEIAVRLSCIGDPEEDGARPIDIDKLRGTLEEEWSERPQCNTIIEGHLSHHFQVDCIVILRCHPLILENRYRKRGYTLKKITENTEWEILGGPWNEINLEKSCIEFDSSKLTTQQIFEGFMSWIADGFKPMDASKVIDWVTRMDE